jgi:hypothetical protein
MLTVLTIFNKFQMHNLPSFGIAQSQAQRRSSSIDRKHAKFSNLLFALFAHLVIFKCHYHDHRAASALFLRRYELS